MSLPVPRPGLVISYSYLWYREHLGNTEEGQKIRPCVIVVAHRIVEGRKIVTVVPITHSPPEQSADAIEVPAAVKGNLGLDELPSWIMLIEFNEFLWPGPDLRRLANSTPPRFDYGFLPPRFFCPCQGAAAAIVSTSQCRACAAYGVAGKPTQPGGVDVADSSERHSIWTDRGPPRIGRA